MAHALTPRRALLSRNPNPWQDARKSGGAGLSHMSGKFLRALHYVNPTGSRCCEVFRVARNQGADSFRSLSRVYGHTCTPQHPCYLPGLHLSGWPSLGLPEPQLPATAPGRLGLAPRAPAAGWECRRAAQAGTPRAARSGVATCPSTRRSRARGRRPSTR
jgi:hypothetical protein